VQICTQPPRQGYWANRPRQHCLDGSALACDCESLDRRPARSRYGRRAAASRRLSLVAAPSSMRSRRPERAHAPFMVRSSHGLEPDAAVARCRCRTKAAASAGAHAHRAGNPDRPARRQAHRTGAIAASPKRSPIWGARRRGSDRRARCPEATRSRAAESHLTELTDRVDPPGGSAPEDHLRGEPTRCDALDRCLQRNRGPVALGFRS
jgi:hypothetical protein